MLTIKSFISLSCIEIHAATYYHSTYVPSFFTVGCRTIRQSLYGKGCQSVGNPSFPKTSRTIRQGRGLRARIRVAGNNYGSKSGQLHVHGGSDWSILLSDGGQKPVAAVRHQEHWHGGQSVHRQGGQRRHQRDRRQSGESCLQQPNCLQESDRFTIVIDFRYFQEDSQAFWYFHTEMCFVSGKKLTFCDIRQYQIYFDDVIKSELYSPQVRKISSALISSEINDEEVDEELERFRLQRAKESGREEQDAKEALVQFQLLLSFQI